MRRRILIAFVLLLRAARLEGGGAPYREALPGYVYSFPRDHFEHPDYRTEWWYYTGNVWTPQGRRFGFELVFFRQGQRFGDRDNPSAWRVDDVYLADAAVTDIDTGRFLFRERLNRAGPGIAGASFQQTRIWNGNWSDAWNGDRQKLVVTTVDFSFDLDCAPEKPAIINGENGVSQKSEGAGHASHYVSFPLLRVSGSIRSGGTQYRVSGQAWMDHEWFTQQLAANQTGWDWFSVQLNNGVELMLFELRRKGGGFDPFSSGTYVAPSGKATHLTASEFSLHPKQWSNGYPVVWEIEVPALKLRLECHARLNNQEITGSAGPVYWEGAVDYSGSEKGFGYLEMTGYRSPMTLP